MTEELPAGSHVHSTVQRTPGYLAGIAAVMTIGKPFVAYLVIPRFLPIVLSDLVVLTSTAVAMRLRKSEHPCVFFVTAAAGLVALGFQVRLFPVRFYASSFPLDAVYVIVLLQGMLLVSACILSCMKWAGAAVLAELIGLEQYAVQKALPDPLLLGGLLGAFTVLLAVVLYQLRIIGAQQAETDRLYREQQQLNRNLSIAAAKLMEEKRRKTTGSIATGLAHEINNPVNYMRGNLSFVRQYFDELLAIVEPQEMNSTVRSEMESRRDDLQSILTRFYEGLTRISEIVRNLRSVAGSKKPKMEVVDVEEVIASSIDFLGLGNENEIECRTTIRVPMYVYCDRADLYTVFFNLLRNAQEACDGKGRIDIAGTVNGGEVAVSISDNGRGIPADSLSRIFEPFYTSKPDHEHMGVGLALCRDIVERYGGRIDAAGTEGEYACFTVVLPSA